MAICSNLLCGGLTNFYKAVYLKPPHGDTMAEENVPAQAPTRTDEQILPRNAWLQIGKSNLLLDIQKMQKNLIFQTLTGIYSCQLDEQWFDLNADLLRNALDITPTNPTHPFELPPTGDAVMDFVNQLGYPEPCLTGKIFSSDKPRHHVLQMLWGIITRTNVDHVELMWEEFVQGIQTFFNHKATQNIPNKKPTPLLIPFGRFTKLIIYYLSSNHNIHRRPESVVHLTGDDFLLGNLKFVPKGEKNEVFADSQRSYY
ncbi:hypothetical protein Tco_0529991 [Tanacetum coccineum]